ncbi:MAG: CobD/CbiB family cobalamin biosynthesis protein [Ruminococcus sp.]
MLCSSYSVGCPAGSLLRRPVVWLPHPVVWIGKGISAHGKTVSAGNGFGRRPSGERAAGYRCWQSAFRWQACWNFTAGALALAYRVSFWLWVCCCIHFGAYQILAARCLATESQKVYRKRCSLADLYRVPEQQLSWLVGTDTQSLSEEEVTKACVETVAENTSDGVTAPLFYLLIGGVPLGFLYKAVNTLDSMVGYSQRNLSDTFGKAAAKLDDALELAAGSAFRAALMIRAAAGFLRLDAKAGMADFPQRPAASIFPPNSAQTESVAAGALGIRLGGTHLYFWQACEKTNHRRCPPSRQTGGHSHCQPADDWNVHPERTGIRCSSIPDCFWNEVKP